MKILAIDGNSIMNRAYYGIKILSNSKGFFTNAITGFMNIYLKELEAVKPDFCIAAFDLRSPTFRHKKVASYKANRKGMPDELAMQMPKIKELLQALGVMVLELEGFEADDILGTVASLAESKESECYLLTGDRDSLQLISDKVTVRLATNKETILFNKARFEEAYGFEPPSLIDLKAFMGDSSDNISGVKGIGEKTAMSLIAQYKTVDGVYENLDNAQLTANVKAKLKDGKKDAEQSRWLATIIKDVPLDIDIFDGKNYKKDEDKAAKLLKELEMFKLLERIQISPGAVQTEEKKEIMQKLEPCWIKQLTDEIAASIGDCAFIFNNGQLAVFCDNTVYTPLMNSAVDIFFENKCKKLTFNAKPAYKYCFENGLKLNGINFCCDLAGYLLQSQSVDYTVENLCSAYGVQYRSDMGEYADICSLTPLGNALKEKTHENGMDSLLYDIEQPLCEVLASMEVLGVRVNTNGVREFGDMLSEKTEEITKEIYELCGKEFNISSPKQLGAVLFEDLGLPAKKKTKSGYSTNVDVLESLIDLHPCISKILEYRTLTKLNSTYVEGLLKVIREDGRVHSVFKQTETKTGRISSTEPNVQNIPVRKELGRNMRKFFVARDGYTLLDADYSQIELRVLASVSGDENMQAAFMSGKDIHTSTASQVFNVPEEFVTPEMRSAAKAVNFGIIYGIGAFSLANDIGVSVGESKKYIAQYLANYPKVSEFMNSTIEFGINNHYVTTIFGRRRYIPELSSSNKILQAFGKRAAMNAPIQGAAADIIKVAMVKVYKRLANEGLDAWLILQVHDELIIEASLCDKDKASIIIREEMENACKLAVPLIAEVNEGDSWYKAKG